MPVVNDLGAHPEYPHDLGVSAEGDDYGVVCFESFALHRQRRYTARLSKASAKSESPLPAEIHIFPGADDYMKGDPAVDEAAKRLRVVLIALGKEAKELAEELYITPQAFNNYVTGDRPVPIKKMVRLADLYGIPTDYIYRGVYDGMTQIVRAMIRDAEEKFEEGPQKGKAAKE